MIRSRNSLSFAILILEAFVSDQMTGNCYPDWIRLSGGHIAQSKICLHLFDSIVLGLICIDYPDPLLIAFLNQSSIVIRIDMNDSVNPTCPYELRGIQCSAAVLHDVCALRYMCVVHAHGMRHRHTLSFRAIGAHSARAYHCYFISLGVTQSLSVVIWRQSGSHQTDNIGRLSNTNTRV